MGHTVGKNMYGTSLFRHTVEDSGNPGIAKHNVLADLVVKTSYRTSMLDQKTSKMDHTAKKQCIRHFYFWYVLVCCRVSRSYFSAMLSCSWNHCLVNWVSGLVL